MSVGSDGGAPAGRAHHVARAGAAAVAVALLVVLLWPDGGVVNRAVVDVYLFFLERGMPPSVTPAAYAVLLNVAAFVLLGWLGVSLLRWPALRVVLSLTALSCAVELVQAFPSFGRDPSLLDVACNTLGAVLGAVAASVVGRRRRRGGGAADGEAGVDQPADEHRDVGGDRLGG